MRLSALGYVFAAVLLCGVAGCAPYEPPEPLKPAPTAAPAPSDRDAAERRKLAAAFGGATHDAGLEDYLNGVLQKLASASDQPSAPYRVTILNSPFVNAFALPSGDIYLTRGLLALADDEAEIAAVMAHEIAHVTARHAAQRAEMERNAALFKRVARQVLASPDNGEEEAQRASLSLAKFSRDQEFEADKIGIRVIARAGYDPYAASRFLSALGRWSALKKESEGALDMTATHPSTTERVQAAAAEARAFGAPGVGAEEREPYLKAIDRLTFGDDPDQGVVRGRTFTHVKFGFAFTAPEGFTLENQMTAVIGVSADGGEALRLDSVAADPGVTPEASLAKGWIDGVETKNIEPLKIGDLSAATATAAGQAWSFRLGAIRLGGRLIRLVFAARSLTPAVDEGFRASLMSFHRLDPAEAAAVVGLKVHVEAAQPGETSATFANRMARAADPTAEFLVLNGLNGSGPLTAGQLYKFVAP